jgi:hypothetical protein
MKPEKIGCKRMPCTKEKKRLGLFSALGNTEIKTKLIDDNSFI